MTIPAPVRLHALGPLELPGNCLPDLQRRLASYLEISVSIGETLPLPPTLEAGNPSSPVPSNDIVDYLIGRSESSLDPEGTWVLGVTAFDLIAPRRRFVFGEATVGGAWAILSTARLVLDQPPSTADYHRIEKEALHELGHLAGLDHCATPTCVMAPSPDAAAVDLKSARFCDACQRLFFGGSRT